MMKWIGIGVLLLIMAVTISGCEQASTIPEMGPVEEEEPSLLDESSGESERMVRVHIACTSQPSLSSAYPTGGGSSDTSCWAAAACASPSSRSAR